MRQQCIKRVRSKKLSKQDEEYGPLSFWIGALCVVMLALGLVSHAWPITVVSTVVGLVAWLRFAWLTRQR